MSDRRLDVFISACRREFAWVEDELGLRVVPTQLPNVIAFGCARFELVVGWVPRVSEPSKRIDAQLVDSRREADYSGGPSESYPGYRIGSVMSYLNPTLTNTQIYQRVSGYWFHADTDEQIEASVKRMSSEWRKLLTPSLVADEEFWTGLESAGIVAGMRWHGPDSRKEAIEAFDRGDFESALEHYERVPGKLKRADRKRIEIAKRRLAM